MTGPARASNPSLPPIARILPPWSWAVAAMLIIQAAVALSIPFTQRLGAPAAVSLRLGFAALILLALTRPWSAIGRLLRGQDLSVLLLGAATGLMTLCYFAAAARIPLGLSNAIEFMGPLGVALWHSRNRRGAALAAMAGGGVLLLLLPSLPLPPALLAALGPLTGPPTHAGAAGWHADPLGLLLASAAASFWAAYILLTRRIGARFAGAQGLAISITVAALITLPIGLPGAIAHAHPTDLLALLGLGLMTPVIPFALEMAALRHIPPGRFGLLMSLEPAAALGFGVILLGQIPQPIQLAGFAAVLAANALASRSPASGT